MHVQRPSSNTVRELAKAFNSLFEMLTVVQEATEVLCRLSILYLRCVTGILSIVSLTVHDMSFNSLFEMPADTWAPHPHPPRFVLSILYLRCKHKTTTQPRAQLKALSILYLRCAFLTTFETAVMALLLSILYLRCGVFPRSVSTRCLDVSFNSLFEMPQDVAASRHFVDSDFQFSI